MLQWCFQLFVWFAAFTCRRSEFFFTAALVVLGFSCVVVPVQVLLILRVWCRVKHPEEFEADEEFTHQPDAANEVSFACSFITH